MISTTTCKQLLRIGDVDATRDALIAVLIPIVYIDIINECNNSFKAPNFDMTSDGIYFDETGGVFSINLAAGGFAAMLWPTGGTLVVEGSRLNDGLFTIATQTDTKVTTTEAIIDETQTTPAYDVTVAMSVFPKPVDLIAARMVGYQLDNVRSAGLLGERIGNYSYYRAAGDKDGNYPSSLMRGLTPWKRHVTGIGSVRWHINENRIWMRMGAQGIKGLNIYGD